MGISSFILFRLGKSMRTYLLSSAARNICRKEKLFFDKDEETYNSVTSLTYAMTVGKIVDVRPGIIRKFRRELRNVY
ncbi:hypothetical protein SAMN05428961_10493 [Paenibacillus sp. OK060]|nr:hypothetical protein SAMN05428961_10493 [Paenibacillus sp. OK060]SEB02070.1 hypothetical protein SAMN03159332_2958 [Paenibacillus sp. 276b]